MVALKVNVSCKLYCLNFVYTHSWYRLIEEAHKSCLCSTRQTESILWMSSLANEFLRFAEMTMLYGQVEWTPRGVSRPQPKLEFYNRFMNVLKCFAEPVFWLSVQGFTCLQIKRGQTGPNFFLCLFLHSGVRSQYSPAFKRISVVQFDVLNPYTLDMFLSRCLYVFRFHF